MDNQTTKQARFNSALGFVEAEQSRAETPKQHGACLVYLVHMGVPSCAKKKEEGGSGRYEG